MHKHKITTSKKEEVNNAKKIGFFWVTIMVLYGFEWRPPPLWGIGLTLLVNGHTNLLHDGRARNLIEAILWHGGKTDDTKEFFYSAKKIGRQ